MTISSNDLVGAVLDKLIFDWDTQSCTMLFKAGLSNVQGRFSVTFVNVAQMSLPTTGEASSVAVVSELRDAVFGLFELVLESGDIIAIATSFTPVFSRGAALGPDLKMH